MLNKFTKVNETITINRYDNGWMMEISGRDKNNDWKTIKTLCNSEDDIFALIKEWNATELDS